MIHHAPCHAAARRVSLLPLRPPSLAMSRPDPTAKRAQTDRKADDTAPGRCRRTMNAKCGRRGNLSGSEPVHSKKLRSAVTSASAAETSEVATLPVARRGQGQGGGWLNQLRFASARARRQSEAKANVGTGKEAEESCTALGARSRGLGVRSRSCARLALYLFVRGLRPSPLAARAQSLTSHKGQRTSRLRG